MLQRHELSIGPHIRDLLGGIIIDPLILICIVILYHGAGRMTSNKKPQLRGLVSMIM